jgi:hypothetical protein
MPERNSASDWKEMLMGLVVIAAVFAAIGYSIRFVYRKYFSPAPAVVSLSAYYVDDSGVAVSPEDSNYTRSHLRIRGDITRDGQPPKSGNVRLTVSSTKNELFRQSISLAMQAGHFETEDPAFRSVRPGSPIEIKADIVGGGPHETATINLNSAPPVDKSALEIFLLALVSVLSVVFFVAFTGKETPRKNRTAIIFSYLVIGIFLAVPLLAPVVLLRMFPSAVDGMIGMPAGLVNTHTANQPENETQWALNIGGYSFRVPAKSVTQKASDDTAFTGSAIAGGVQGVGAGSTAPSPSSSPTTTSREKTNPTASTTPVSVKSPALPPSVDLPQTLLSSESRAPVVQVYGGLVIPLYVIILSVIGGAINMTRKVPVFQKEGEESDFSLARPISMVGTAVLSLRRRSSGTEDTPPDSTPPVVAVPPIAEPDTSAEERAKKIDAQLDLLLAEQIQRNEQTDSTLTQIRSLVSNMQELYGSRKSDEPLLNFSSFENWASSHPRLRELLRGSWRVELLNQYMYLISAPFLAIVTYYVLDLLGLSKQGVVVVLSFSVGLISERIVSWILGIATGYLRTDAATSSPKKS